MMQMTTRSSLAIVLGVVILAAYGFGTIGRAPIAEAQDSKVTPKEEPGKGKRVQAFIAAFDKGDAKATASFWTEDATYVDQVGREHKGRSAIEKLYAKVFTARKGAKLTIHVISLKQITPDVVLEDGITEVTGSDGVPTSARFSAVIVKKDGEWYFQSVRDSVALPPSNGQHFEDIEFLIGEWASEGEKGGKGEGSTASYAWAENHNFIVSHFATTLNGLPVVGGTQWIGWDAIDKQIRSWSFYSGGGFGEAVWSKDGEKWTLKTTARSADGRKISATNIITKIDDDNITWQLTKLRINGETVPDAKPTKMKRVK
jgi:uncharacterized protein (TIGR02246 family)